MTRVGKALLGAIMATTLVWSCVNGDNVANDDGQSKDPATSNKKDGGLKDGGKKDASPPSTADDDNSDDDNQSDDDTPADDDSGDDDAPDDDTGDDDTGDDDAPPPKDAGGGTKDASGGGTDSGPKPMGGKVKGSATRAMCSSYGKPAGGMCAGYFCGVSLEDIKADWVESDVCDSTAESVCDGQLSFDVATCASDNASASLGNDAKFQTDIQTCVYKKNAEYEKSAPPACLKCFSQAAVCARTNCLIQCLGMPMSPGCDTCRKQNKCNDSVFTCAMIPNPF